MILVTGGCGFIGASLVPQLLADGWDVRVFDALWFGRPASIGHDVEVVEGDIRDLDALGRALRGIDRVVHLAAAGSVVQSVADPVSNFEMNVVGTFTLLRACSEAEIQRIVFASTGGALMGNAGPPVSEESLPWPISPYGASKLCGEAYLHAFAGSFGLETTALRFANVYGPHSLHKKGAVTTFIKRAVRGEPLEIYDEGQTSSRDFLYVDDLCAGISAAVTRPTMSDEVFHLASEQETLITDLARLVIDLTGSTSTLAHRPRRTGEVERNFASAEKAKRCLDFMPKHSMEDGMQATIDWFVDERADWDNFENR